MRKIIALTLIFIVCFSSCKGKDIADIDYGYIVSDGFASVIEEGRLYYDWGTQLLTFYDFELAQSLPVCATPNCAHNKENLCSAYFGGGSAEGYAIYQGKLYYWLDSSGGKCALYCADKDGSNRRKIMTIDGTAKNFIYTNGKVYYIKTKETLDEERQVENSINSNYYITKTYCAACCDLKNEKETILTQEYKSHYGDLTLNSVYKDKLYFNEIKLADGFDEDTYDPNSSASVFDDTVSTTYILDLNSKEETEFLPNLRYSFLVFREKYAVYHIEENDGVTAYLVELDTMKKTIIAELPVNSYVGTILDNKVFYSANQRDFNYTHCYDILTKDTKELKCNLPNTTLMLIDKETSDKFIGFVYYYEDDLETQIGNGWSMVIDKDDYYNGMENYIKISDMG